MIDYYVRFNNGFLGNLSQFGISLKFLLQVDSKKELDIVVLDALYFNAQAVDSYLP